MYAFGAASVKCAVCNTVTHVNHTPLTQPSAQQGPPSSSAGVSAGVSPRPQQSHQTVVIVNPPTLDEEGNEVSAACRNTVRCCSCIRQCCCGVSSLSAHINGNLQAFQLIVLARYLLGVPKP